DQTISTWAKVSESCSFYPCVTLDFQGLRWREWLKTRAKDKRLDTFLRSLLIASTVLLTLLMAVPWTMPARGIVGASVDDSTNTWAPYGPMVSKLQFSFFTNEATEFNAFATGQLDLTDWPLAAANYPSYDANPDYLLSPGQGQFGMFGIDFN